MATKEQKKLEFLQNLHNKRTTNIHVGLLIVRSALSDTLKGCESSVSPCGISFDSKKLGKLTVPWTEEKAPTQQQLDAIQSRANELMTSDLCYAEEELKKESVVELEKSLPGGVAVAIAPFYHTDTIPFVHLTNITATKETVDKHENKQQTKDLGFVYLQRLNHRVAKKEIEFSFTLTTTTPPQACVTAKKTKGNTKQQPKQQAKQQTKSNTQLVVGDTVQLSNKLITMMEAFYKLTPNQQQTQREQLQADVLMELDSLKNSSYASGMKAMRVRTEEWCQSPM